MEQEQEEVQDVSDLKGGRWVIWKDSGDCLSLPHPQERNREDTLLIMLVFRVPMLVLMFAKEETRLWLLGKVTTG